jgi:hypothetical protein
LLSAIGEREFQNDAADIRFERAVKFTGRPAGIVSLFQPLPQGLVKQASANDEYFFRVRVALASEPSGIGPWQEPGQACVFFR